MGIPGSQESKQLTAAAHPPAALQISLETSLLELSISSLARPVSVCVFAYSGLYIGGGKGAKERAVSLSAPPMGIPDS